jgi:hypothetical protein
MTKKSEGRTKRLSVKRQVVTIGEGAKRPLVVIFERTRQREVPRIREREKKKR